MSIILGPAWTDISGPTRSHEACSPNVPDGASYAVHRNQ